MFPSKVTLRQFLAWMKLWILRGEMNKQASKDAYSYIEERCDCSTEELEEWEKWLDIDTNANGNISSCLVVVPKGPEQNI